MKRYIKSNSNASLGLGMSVPTEEDIIFGLASYGGLPIKYNPNMPADARNMSTFIEVSDKFFTHDTATQQHILNHEVAHNFSDMLCAEHTGDWQKFCSAFISEKDIPPTSLAYERGQRTYWEGLYGDIGATAIWETTTQAITEYLDDPHRLKQRSQDAYTIIDEFLKRKLQ